MEYTVAQLSRLAGVSVRTLHWYDEIGLLRPAHTTPAGYRLYGPAQVDRLQDILFYRALGFALKDIGPLLDDASFDRLSALEHHREALCAQRARLDALLQTLADTIAHVKGAHDMNDPEKFTGLKEAAIRENEQAYGAEVRRTWGDEAADAVNARLMGLSPQEHARWKQLEQRILSALEDAVRRGLTPQSDEGARIAALHREWLGFAWPRYSAQAHRGLVQMYTADERFTAYYDARQPGCARFLQDAVLTHI